MAFESPQNRGHFLSLESGKEPNHYNGSVLYWRTFCGNMKGVPMA